MLAQASTPRFSDIAPLLDTEVTANAPVYRRVRITPTVAMMLLTNSIENRPIDKLHVRALSEAMQAGQWMPDTNTIKLDRQGRLLDGQHRLNAVIAAGAAGMQDGVVMEVVIGVDKEIIKHVDTNRKRTTGQTLALLGRKLPTIQLATANLLAHYERVSRGATEFASRVTTLNPDATLVLLSRYSRELEDMQPMLQEHNAACVYAPLVFAARRYPEAALGALEFLRNGQVAGPSAHILAKFHAGQKRIHKAALGDSQERIKTQIFVFELVRGLVTQPGNPRTPGKTHTNSDLTALVMFFAVPANITATS